MAFMLGSFTDGMFGGARGVENICGLYQENQQRQLGLDAANAWKKDSSDAANADAGLPSQAVNKTNGMSDPVDRSGDPGQGYTALNTTTEYNEEGTPPAFRCPKPHEEVPAAPPPIIP